MGNQQVANYTKAGSGKYRGSKSGRRQAQDRKKQQDAIKHLKNRLVAFALILAGVTGTLTGVITKAKNKSNEAKNTQEAIIMASEYIDSIQEQLSNTTIQEYSKIHSLQELNDSIIIYSELGEKGKRSADEEKRYIDACTSICENKDFVKDVYTDTIKSKIAEAYGITDPYQIMRIIVKDIVYTPFPTYDHNPQIKLPDGTEIFEDSMDKKLQDAIINARHLIDVDYDSNMNFKDLPVQDIVNTYKNAMSFQLDYKVSVDKDGKLITSEIVEEDRSTNNGNKNYDITYDLDDRDDR